MALFHSIMFSCFNTFLYILIYCTYYSMATWQIPKKESHMAYALYATQSKQSKFAAGKFCNSFSGQLFFRLGCTLMDKAKSMRHPACIPDSWWEFAFAHATHIYNRTLVACLNWHTPHEMLKGELPNIDHICVFGCGAFVYLPAMARANKMDSKSELMTYISVAPGNEHNFLFMHSTNAVFTAAHAIFDEHHFPRCPKNRHNPLKNPLGGVIPKPSTDQPGNIADDTNSDDDVDHNHGYPHPKHRMMIQSTRNPRLLRKSLINQILQELLLLCLHCH